MTEFGVAAALTADGPGQWRVDLPADWGQGRTTFGGLVAAIALEAAQRVAGADRPVRSLDIAFVAPLPPGPAVVTTEVLSQGRSATQLTVDLRSAQGVLGARLLVVAGTSRVSTIEIPGPAPVLDQSGPPEDSGIEFPYLPGVTPAFIQNVQMRWCGPAFPFSSAGPEGAVTRAWVRHRTSPDGSSPDAAALALLDAAPPMVLPMAAGPMPASTVRWAAHLLEPVPAAAVAASSGWFWLEGEALHAHDGYTVEQSRLFLGGRLVAWAEQLVAVYDRPAG